MNRDSHFVLILIDGMRPDGMLQAETPVMDKLRASGAFTLSARTVMPSITLPCHMSLFLSVRPSRHGITTNLWTPQARPVPGLFDILHQAGLVTASFYNWEELRDLSRPGSLDASFMTKIGKVEGCADVEITQLAVNWLSTHQFNFAFIYLGGTDTSGHDFGWMHPKYFDAIAQADRCIGSILATLPQDCTVMITSDHGGHEQNHGTDSQEDMVIPVIVAGPSIQGPSTIKKEVQITDIAPTIADYFGVAAPDEWIGQPITFNRKT